MNEVLKAQNDVTVFADGNVTISQRKLAALLGVNENTLIYHVRTTHKNHNTSNGLDAFLVAKTTHYFATKAKTRTKQAIELNEKMLEAGAKYGLKLITHGFNIGRYGQSDLFIGHQPA